MIKISAESLESFQAEKGIVFTAEEQETIELISKMNSGEFGTCDPDDF